MDPVLQQILTKAAEAGVQTLGFIVSTAPVWGPVAWSLGKPLLRAFVLRAAGAQTAAAMDALEGVMKPAISAAVDHLQQQIRLAQRADSPGGMVVTPDEYRAAVASAAQGAWSTLDKRGVLKGVVEAYGGEEAVRASIRVLLERGLSKHHGLDRPAERPAERRSGA